MCILFHEHDVDILMGACAALIIKRLPEICRAKGIAMMNFLTSHIEATKSSHLKVSLK